MKSSMLFAGIGLSALLLAACENEAQTQSEERAEKAMEYQESAKDANAQPAKDAPKPDTKANGPDSKANGDESKAGDPKMMEVKPAQPSDGSSNQSQ